MNIIEVERLGRKFKGLKAVDGLSFTIEEGEIFGFLGPNGAGKTTTIRMLTGQLLPTSGQARVAGCDVSREQERLKPQIGVVFERQNLYERMTARENLAFYAKLYNVNRSQIDALLEQVGLVARAGDRVRNYSNGMKQHLLIARALLHQPRVLFLDEPTRGLDPSAARELRSLVKELARKGATIFLTTHYMEEADQLCSRVAIVNEGRIAALDAPERLKVMHGQRRVHVLLDDGQRLAFAMGDHAAGSRLGQLVGEGRALTLHSNEATLEEVFIKLTGKRLQ